PLKRSPAPGRMLPASSAFANRARRWRSAVDTDGSLRAVARALRESRGAPWPATRLQGRQVREEIRRGPRVHPPAKSRICKHRLDSRPLCPALRPLAISRFFSSGASNSRVCRNWWLEGSRGASPQRVLQGPTGSIANNRRRSCYVEALGQFV